MYVCMYVLQKLPLSVADYAPCVKFVNGMSEIHKTL